MKLLLLNGSPKPGNSTSGSILEYISDRSKDKCEQVESVRFRDVIDHEIKFKDLMQKVDDSDTIVIAFPVYIDSLPYPLTRALDDIYRQKGSLSEKERSILVIGNCGFPEQIHIKLSIQMLKLFSKRMNFRWRGAIEIGGGGVISEKPLPEVGGVIKNIVYAIDRSMDSIQKGEDIKEVDIEKLKKPMMSPFVSRTMGNLGWRLIARKNKIKGNIKHRPYDEK